MNIRKACILAMLCMAGLLPRLSSQEALDPSALFQQLQSKETTENAKEFLLRRANTDQEVRKYLANNLPAMIQGAKGATASWLSAVRLAGELKITEAAPALTTRIGE